VLLMPYSYALMAFEAWSSAIINKIFGCSDKANLSIVLFKSNQINFDKAIS